MEQENIQGEERRRYLRLDSVFPVEFRFFSLDRKGFISDWLQGFTSNISKGGLCLEVNNLSPELLQSLKDKTAKLSLMIELPVVKAPVKSEATVAWVKDMGGVVDKHLIGLIYENIDPRQNNLIMRYAVAKKLFVPLVLTVVCILGISLLVNSYFNIKLIKGNKVLVEQLVSTLQETRAAKEKIQEINREREDSLNKIKALQSDIKIIIEEKAGLEQQRAQYGEKAKVEKGKAFQRIAELGISIDRLNREKDLLQKKVISLQEKEETVSAEMLFLDKKKMVLEKANLEKMYKWLLVHQNPRTGLVMSFEGDSEIANSAFVYDQSLVAQVYVKFSEPEKARKILDFFNKKAKRSNGWFYNAYDTQEGTPVEYVIHSGPNIWLGIAILQYTQRTKDARYLELAQEISQTVMKLQALDKDGGIRGGPQVEWFATEHNLDAYAFFNMLYKITGKNNYLEARDKVLKWLIQHTYDKTGVPVKRGKGDSTIATDTYAWSIAAIGPGKLEEIGMNPDKVLEFAEQNCRVETFYTRPEGQSTKIAGFDFAPQKNVGRGGVVSSEWTAQMVVTFKIMADFYAKKGIPQKAKAYLDKAEEYLGELGKMVISSPSPSGQGESCLPYATQDFVDTGHGWMTPKGKATGSVSGTAYTLFAYYDYNPLEL